MPELPEVETVKETLKKKILKQKIIDIKVLYPEMIEYPDVLTFKKEIINQTINDIKRRGKWLIFELDNYYLLSHLRMEGKYNIKTNESINKHEHVIFYFKDFNLRYQDTRKFGRMYLYKKEEAFNNKPLNALGYEPWDDKLDIDYLKEKYKKITKPIKEVLLDQSIIVGIGNIYADEILFLSKINPYKKPNELDDNELNDIIKNTRYVLECAIKKGGTTIRTYTSSEGVHGRFQQDLLVHNKEYCKKCNSKIEVVRIGGRSTYYCPNCQKNCQK